MQKYGAKGLELDAKYITPKFGCKICPQSFTPLKLDAKSSKNFVSVNTMLGPKFVGTELMSRSHICQNALQMEEKKLTKGRINHPASDTMLHIKVRLSVLLCAVKTVEGDFQFCWPIFPNVGQTHKEIPNLVRIFYMIFTLNDIYKQYNKLHKH